ncbi:penicillin-binding protein activator [Vibrio sp. Of14-4]|uniref:penicillin-binding protein activator n=1 Tax=Vibrio sp. Of14-4 TaxID=2724878 RepID=UPI001EF2C33E|nr:penicillin-binding protein activator [Vibrio sp. Of14-4]MCG7488751.1 penicillin-binding protein activator [Vibrio sp. Of14-4]
MAMNNHKRRSVTRILTPVALAVILTACSTAPSKQTNVDITLSPNQSTRTYLMRADSSQGNIQNDWLIMALKAAIKSNDYTQSDLLIRRLARQDLSHMQQAEWQLARTELLIKQAQYDEALNNLNFDASWKLADVQWQAYHQVKAQLFNRQTNYFEAARELVASAKYAQPSLQKGISQSIWDNLSQYNQYQITEFTANRDEEVLDGWLQLSIYTKTLSANLSQLKNTLEKWLEENPNHPAALYTPSGIIDLLNLEVTKPVNTALLLPLSGKFSKQAQLIRDGFILEMMNDTQRDENASLTIIDTNNTTVEQLEQTLVEKRIDFVVGPLIKSNIDKLTQAQSSFSQPLPTLALNIPDNLESGNNTCYLALSPEQEVSQAAKHLYSQGYRYPLILAPKGSLGVRVVEAFEQEWKKHSNNHVAVNLFGDKRQLQKDINKVFGLQESQQHIAQMESLLNIPLKTQPRSRRDIDAVYIVAGNAELTLIKPFIEVAVNPDTIPPKLFSNSRSNSGRQQYEDLSGVMYSDIPLLVQPNESLEAQMELLWPKDSNSEKRLQALGMDAYLLMEQLPQMKIVDGYTLQGNTGLLSLSSDCVVQREISWAEYGQVE